MQTNVQIDSKNLRSSPDHIKHRGHLTIEVSFIRFFFKCFLFFLKLLSLKIFPKIYYFKDFLPIKRIK